MNKLMPLICIYVFAKFELKSSSSAMRFKKHNQVMFYQTNNSNIFNSLTLSLALERKSFIESQTIIHFVRVEAIRWHFFHHTMRRRWRDLTTKFCINFILSSLSLSLTHSLVLCYLLNLNLFFRFFLIIYFLESSQVHTRHGNFLELHSRFQIHSQSSALTSYNQLCCCYGTSKSNARYTQQQSHK